MDLPQTGVDEYSVLKIETTYLLVEANCLPHSGFHVRYLAFSSQPRHEKE